MKLLVAAVKLNSRAGGSGWGAIVVQCEDARNSNDRSPHVLVEVDALWMVKDCTLKYWDGGVAPLEAVDSDDGMEDIHMSGMLRNNVVQNGGRRGMESMFWERVAVASHMENVDEAGSDLATPDTPSHDNLLSLPTSWGSWDERRIAWVLAF